MDTRRTSIEPYRERSSLGAIPGFYEPEEGVDTVVLLNGSEREGREGDVACVLFLGAENGRACAGVRALV
jgi:hypothetical protein